MAIGAFAKAVGAGFKHSKKLEGVAKAEGALGLGVFGGSLLAGAQEGVDNIKVGRQAMSRLDDAQMMMNREQDQLLKQVEENTKRIMDLRPELAQTLLAGRRLPRGAVVLGGQPRSDILESVALAMAQANPDTPPSMGFAPELPF